MLRLIDGFLNRTTMYRLVLYVLAVLWIVAFAFSVIGVLPFDPIGLLLAALVLLGVSFVTNEVFARVFKTSTNIESVYITAFILALIVAPPKLSEFVAYLPFLIIVSVIAIASKYILAVNKKHLFNPAALAVAVTAAFLNQSASWWIGGNFTMLPFVLIGGFLIVKKIQRWDLVLSFAAGAFVSVAVSNYLRGFSPIDGIQKAVLHSPLLFFAFVMITEPLTTPPTRRLRMWYGALVGLVFSPWVHVGSVYSTPELALLVGNAFSYIVSPKGKFVLKLKEKLKLTPTTYDFLFTGNRMKFRPGQYLEWTLGHMHPDNRGNRRYFTIASSPTEKELRLGLKFYPNSSSFKRTLLAMEPGGEIMAGQLAGDFVLPADPKQKLAFIAGGIGVTPYRSMLKYLIDTNENRDIVHFYSNRDATEIVYRDIFDEAEKMFGIKTVYLLNDVKELPLGWQGYNAMLNPDIVKKETPDYLERTFYISGPHSMIMGLENMLQSMGVPRRQIKTDFFPGFA